jgi:hypothetical protein
VKPLTTWRRIARGALTNAVVLAGMAAAGSLVDEAPATVLTFMAGMALMQLLLWWSIVHYIENLDE